MLALTSLNPFELAKHFVNLFVGRQRHKNACLVSELGPQSEEVAPHHSEGTLSKGEKVKGQREIIRKPYFRLLNQYLMSKKPEI